MTLLSMYKRDDSRTVYRILADQAVRYFDQPRAAANTKILFANLARLLERYRYGAFSNYVAPGILEVFRTHSAAQGAEYSPPNRKTLAVLSALEAAHARVYGTLSKEDVVQALQALLAQLATPTASNDLRSTQELENARLFFFTLSERLKERST